MIYINYFALQRFCRGCGCSYCRLFMRHISKSLLINSGLPLGPFLFFIYLSKVTHCFHTGKYHLYTDDTQIYYSFDIKHVNSDKDVISNKLAKLSAFSEFHGFRLNPNITSMIPFGGLAVSLYH